MPPQLNPYLARMARFTDGAEHASRRAEVLAALPPVAGLEQLAFDQTAALAMARVDVVPIARRVPVAVLGGVLGCGDLSAEIGVLCDDGVVSHGLPDLAVTSLLFQCRDATAALIVNALADAVPVERAESVVLTRREKDVWVLLADAPFGGGTHACPGREHALALARGVVRAFAGYVVVERGPYEPRVNIRVPASLIMERR